MRPDNPLLRSDTVRQQAAQARKDASALTAHVLVLKQQVEEAVARAQQQLAAADAAIARSLQVLEETRVLLARLAQCGDVMPNSSLPFMELVLPPQIIVVGHHRGCEG